MVRVAIAQISRSIIYKSVEIKCSGIIVDSYSRITGDLILIHYHFYMRLDTLMPRRDT